jgi:hypothetical protein
MGNSEKVFVIGMFRTGTSSLGGALSTLGYNTLKVPWYFINDPYWNGVSNLIKHFKSEILQKVSEYDAFKDFLWMFLFKELNEWIPGSKFIYTTRDLDSVVRSEQACYTNGYMYRNLRVPVKFPTPTEERIKERYIKHEEKVRDYFKTSDDNFLELNLSEGDGWEKLCSFLNKPTPAGEFPHINSSSKSQ